MLQANPITTILRDYPVIILDGAMATELERRGCDLNDPLWSAKVLIEQPDLIAEVHRDYFAAGADCAITASYQASIAGFARRGLSEAAATELMRRSVALAIAARDTFWADVRNRVGRPKPFIAASIGPYGAFLADGSEYRGDYDLSEAALITFHRPRMREVVAAGAEILACETIPAFIEAHALATLLGEFPSMSAWISFSARDDAHISDGTPFAECVALLNHFPQVVALGINCTAPRHIPALVETARRATTKPIVVYPNSGETYDPVQKCWSGVATCAEYCEAARVWYAAGARLIGGCCRTTPAHIRELAGERGT